MQPLQLWRKEFHQRIAFLDAQEQKAIEELKMEAQRCRDKWYVHTYGLLWEQSLSALGQLCHLHYLIYHVA